jgi:hypothetical protein
MHLWCLGQTLRNGYLSNAPLLRQDGFCYPCNMMNYQDQAVESPGAQATAMVSFCGKPADSIPLRATSESPEAIPKRMDLSASCAKGDMRHLL